MKIMTILEMLEEKKITVDEAVDLIKSIDISDEVDINESEIVRGKSRWIKIKVKDGEKGSKINLPPLPLGLMGSLASWGVKMGIRHSDEKEILEKLDSREIKNLFNVLRNHPPMRIVEVEDDDGSVVQIYTK
ncbi:hypothetical protein SAMN02745751_01914 [Dethiosulfatibacter aminovorans DSM 17477]|uniref:DUF2089 domain-containing protein n=1 Tax=Dethiosulfatibacter aminovorans DSM 17477 TaxID=1121476 RepID=A0A1M6H4V8_9FIRM|nr:hypothetical protein [Dethiosulfatibacter aminovorans]SHJ17119.1 hypothetical protein SAMN02745751_01914 [Dethiosulfatibacter aminovorans DSM 17477]